MSLLPILTGQIKLRACDWAVEGKGRAGGFREGQERKERGRRRWRRQSKMDDKGVEGSWRRTTWPAEVTSNNGFHS